MVGMRSLVYDAVASASDGGLTERQVVLRPSEQQERHYPRA
jgi:hypothetical protein